jgi:transcriptional regulator with XRE-family HTH domain
MIDVRQLPDAWDTFNRLFGEEGSKNDGLYDIYYRISTAIFDYRIKENLSQKELAKNLGVTQAMVSKLESGDYNYSIEQLWKISQKLGFKLSITFEEESKEDSVNPLTMERQAQIIDYPKLAVG